MKKYRPRNFGSRKNVMAGTVSGATFSTPPYNKKPSSLKGKSQVSNSQKERPGSNGRYQTVLMAENVAKFQCRNVDNKMPQMTVSLGSGPAPPTFSTPSYHDKSDVEGEKRYGAYVVIHSKLI